MFKVQIFKNNGELPISEVCKSIQVNSTHDLILIKLNGVEYVYEYKLDYDFFYVLEN